MFDFSKKLVLFNRDGILNKNVLVRRLEELRLLSNALCGIARLTQACFRVGVCTRQGGITRSMLDKAMLVRIQEHLLLIVRDFGGDIARIVFFASADTDHPWRKPNPVMLPSQTAYSSITLAGVPFVGDNLPDVLATCTAGAVSALVKPGNGRKHRAKLEGVAIYANVEMAVNSWLKEAA